MNVGELIARLLRVDPDLYAFCPNERGEESDVREVSLAPARGSLPRRVVLVQGDRHAVEALDACALGDRLGSFDLRLPVYVADPRTGEAEAEYAAPEFWGLVGDFMQCMRILPAASPSRLTYDPD